MKVNINQIKTISEPLKKELVWDALNNVENLICRLYSDNGSSDIYNEKMKEIFYQLNDFAISLAEDGDMEWQLKDKEREQEEKLNNLFKEGQ